MISWLLDAHWAHKPTYSLRSIGRAESIGQVAFSSACPFAHELWSCQLSRSDSACEYLSAGIGPAKPPKNCLAIPMLYFGLNFLLFSSPNRRHIAQIFVMICLRKVSFMSDKRAKFVRLAEGRVQGALNSIRKIGNLSNKRSYEYDGDDVRKITRALKEAVAEVERKFDPSSVAKEKTFKL
jgi:hypothetical protein